MLPRASASRNLRARWVRDSLSHEAISVVEFTLVGMRSASAPTASMPAISRSPNAGPLAGLAGYPQDSVAGKKGRDRDPGLVLLMSSLTASAGPPPEWLR